MANKIKPKPYKAPVYNEHFKSTSISSLNELLQILFSFIIHALATNQPAPSKYIQLLDALWTVKKDHHSVIKVLREHLRTRKFEPGTQECIVRYMSIYDLYIKSDMPTGFEPGSPSEDAAYLASQP